MTERLYDTWPEHKGKHVKVVAPWGIVDGVLLGLAVPPPNSSKIAPGVELPWALSTSDGREVLVDPDNPALTIYVEGTLVGPLEPPTFLFQQQGYRMRLENKTALEQPQKSLYEYTELLARITSTTKE